MHILILSQEPPFDPVAVATGNALRTHQLAEGLRAAGHRVSQAWLDRAGGKGRFRSADELRGLLQREAPDIILVSYWELLELLPFEGLPPVVLDFLAPRPLESLFETPERAGGLLRRLRVALARADLLLVGNEAQKHLLAYWLIEAGFDLRSSDPVRVVPLAGEVVPCPDRRMPENGFRLVAGGVRWPWRRDDAYREAIRGAVQEIAAAGHAIELIELGGAYRWASDDESNQGEFVTNDDRQSLRSYDDWSELLATAHIGLELGEDHIERRYSQSFRSLDFLRHGLPLLCSAGQPIATAVEATGAGWVVRSPEDIRTVLKAIVEAPETWKPRSAAALELLAKRHAPATAIAPLLEWLDTADKTPRLPGYGLPDPTPPVLGVPPFPERLARRYRLARRIALHRLLVRGETPVRTSIVVVSRHDLFPTDHGAAVKIVETARGLSRHGRDVYLVTHDRTQYWRVRNGVLESKRLPRWLALLARPEPWVKLDHYTRDLPESDAFLYQPLSDGSFFWRALWVAAKHDAACLQAEFPAYLEPCRQAADVLGIPAILVEHNVEYERLRAQVPELTSPQYDRFRAIELRLCNAANAVICVSDNDRQRLAADGVHPGRLHTIPHGIDLATFDRAVPVDVRERFCIPEDAPLLAYHGTFAYPPNRDALVMLAQEILPRLDQRGIEAHVLAIGHRPPKDLHPRIHCVGSVDQVAPWLKAADLAVVPLREGGGTRMKIIDDFAAGLPVIATPKGIEGIPAVDGVEALIRDDWGTFTAAIEQLVRNPEQAENLRRAGRALAETVDWSAIGERYLRLIDTLAR